MILGVPQLQHPLASSWLDEVAHDLMQEPEVIRIKKLLIYACTQTWQTDPGQVNAANLRVLIEQLITIAPSFDALQANLRAVASSLNKAAEYLLIANTITQCLNRRYPRALPATEPRSHQPIYHAITQSLAANSEQSRIKKLLVLACHKTWVRDLEQLAQFDLLKLVQTLHRLAPTPEHLQLLLASRVNKLSKKAEYHAIAQIIIQVFHPLYVKETIAALIGSKSTDSESTELLLTLASQGNAPVQPQEKAPAESAPVAQLIRCQDQVTNLFDLRLEIMRYSNPFRAKILLFSVLHEPFQQTPEHQSMLKNHELDDLLRILIETHKFFKDLETKLKAIVRQLSEPEIYTGVAAVILKLVQPYYSAASTDRHQPQAKPEATDFLKTMTMGEATRPEYSQLLVNGDRHADDAVKDGAA